MILKFIGALPLKKRNLLGVGGVSIVMAVATIPCFASNILNTLKLIRKGHTTIINQRNHKSILNISHFNMHHGDKLKIKQPSKSAILLIRATGGKSMLNGTIESNGKLILVNRAGILFGKTSVIKVGSLVASGFNITNNNFLSGHYHFKNKDIIFRD